MSECNYCLNARCDPIIHSTERVMRWWRSKLELAMRPVPVAAQKSRIAPGLLNVRELRPPAAKRKAGK